jgi:hypothetical protein
MKNLILICALLLCYNGFSQSYITPSTIKSKISKGAVLVEFTTSFATKFKDYSKLHHCTYYRANIEKYPSLKNKYKIRSYPTVILFYNGSQRAKYKADLMFELKATYQDIQSDIDDLFLDKF